jgi:hypothetical protein
MTGAEILAQYGITPEPAPAASLARFSDGAHFRIEIPRVEGPAVFLAAVEAAVAAGVTVNRVSQGSGAMLPGPVFAPWRPVFMIIGFFSRLPVVPADDMSGMWSRSE